MVGIYKWLARGILWILGWKGISTEEIRKIVEAKPGLAFVPPPRWMDALLLHLYLHANPELKKVLFWVGPRLAFREIRQSLTPKETYFLLDTLQQGKVLLVWQQGRVLAKPNRWRTGWCNFAFLESISLTENLASHFSILFLAFDYAKHGVQIKNLRSPQSDNEPFGQWLSFFKQTNALEIAIEMASQNFSSQLPWHGGIATAKKRPSLLPRGRQKIFCTLLVSLIFCCFLCHLKAALI